MTGGSTTTPVLPKVRAAAEMDADTLIAHVNKRHQLTWTVGRSNVPGDVDEHLLRVWHDKVHELKPQNHQHEKRVEE